MLFVRMLPADAAVSRFVGVGGRLRVRLAAVLDRVALEQRLDVVRAQPRERARGIGQRGVVDIGVGRFARCRVVLAELIADGHGVGRALPRAAVGQPSAAHGAVRAVGYDGVFIQVERLLGRQLHVQIVAAFGLIADVGVGEVLERHWQRRRVARGARLVAVEHLFDLRQACACIGERVFAHQHLAVRELVGQLQTGDAGVVRDLLALGHDGAVEILHGLNVLRLGERGVVTVADDAHAFDLRGIRDAAGLAQAEKPSMTDFKPYVGRKRRSGTGCISQINDHLFEGRYSPKWPDGKKHARNVYAHTREECEEKLKVLIAEMKAEIAEAQRLMDLGEGDGSPLEGKKGKRGKKGK